MFTRLLRSAAILGLALALSHATAHADVTYDLTLTPTTGSEGGTGSFTINGPVTGTVFPFGTAYSGANLLTALDFNFMLGGTEYMFDLANKSSNPYGEFLNGALYDLTYQGTIVNTGVQLDLSLQANGLEYSFADIYHPSNDSTGTISAALAPTTAVPEPQPFALLGSVLILLWFPVRKTLSRP